VTPGREFAYAVAGCLAGSAVVLLAAARPWAQGTISRGLGVPVAQVALTGRDLAPSVIGLAVLALAAVAALVATRGAVRRGIGLLVLAAGSGLGLDAALAGGRAAATVAAAAPDATRIDLELAPWPWVAAAGGVFVLGAGLLTVARGARWPTMSRRYDAPSTNQAPAGEAAGRTPEDIWRALDRGDDPTR